MLESEHKAKYARAGGGQVLGQMKRAEAREEEARRQAAMARSVYMAFHRDGAIWIVTFLDRASGNQIGMARRYTSTGPIEEIARRGGALKTQIDHQGLACGFVQGRGSIALHLAPDQYVKLAGGVTGQ